MTLIARRRGPCDAPRESMTFATFDPPENEKDTMKREGVDKGLLVKRNFDSLKRHFSDYQQK